MIERRLITDRETWLQWRRQDLTASDIGAVAGYGPHRSQLAIYAEKTGMIVAQDETPIMRRGRWLEAAILTALREEYPTWRIEKANIYLRDPELRLGATPDFIAEDPAEPHVLINIQGKVITPGVFEREWSNNSSPVGYQLQTLAEGMLMGAGRNLLAALMVDPYNADLAVRDVPRHEAAEVGIRNTTRTFWENIRTGRRPKADYEQDGKILKQMYRPRPELEPVDLTGDNRLPDLLQARAILQERIASDKKGKDDFEGEIIEKLNGAPMAVCGPWKVTWKEEPVETYTVAAHTRRRLYVSQARKGA